MIERSSISTLDSKREKTKHVMILVHTAHHQRAFCISRAREVYLINKGAAFMTPVHIPRAVA